MYDSPRCLVLAAINQMRKNQNRMAPGGFERISCCHLQKTLLKTPLERALQRLFPPDAMLCRTSALNKFIKRFKIGIFQIQCSEELSQLFEYNYDACRFRKRRSMFGNGKTSFEIAQSRLNILYLACNCFLFKFVTHRNSQVS